MISRPTNQPSACSVNKEGSDDKSPDPLINQKSSSSILANVSKKDRSSVENCVEKYSDAVWLISRKFSDSVEEAEKLTYKIFSELWENIENFDCNKTSDDHFILLVAMKCVKKYGKNLH
jgi:hypothetical protein